MSQNLTEAEAQSPVVDDLVNHQAQLLEEFLERSSSEFRNMRSNEFLSVLISDNLFLLKGLRPVVPQVVDLVPMLSQVVTKHVRVLRPFVIITAMNMDNILDKSLLAAVAPAAKRLLRPLSPAVMLQVLQAYVKLRENNPTFMQAMASESIRTLDMFTTEQASQLLLDFANLGQKDMKLIKVLRDKAAFDIGVYAPADLGRLAMAYARFGMEDLELMNAIVSAALWKIHMFSATSLAFMVDAFSQMGYRTEKVDEFIEKGTDIMVEGARDMAPKLQSQLPGNLVRLGYTPPGGMLKNIVAYAVDNSHEFTVQDFGHLAAGLAASGRPSAELFEVIGQKFVKQIDMVGAADLARVVKAHATLKARNEGLAQAGSRRARDLILTFAPGDLSDTAWAYAAWGGKDTELMQAIETRAIETVDQLGLADFTAIIWALDQVGLPNGKMIEECQNQVRGSPAKLVDASTSELGELVWLVSNSQSKEQATRLQEAAMAELESRDVNVDANATPPRFR